MAIIPGGVRPIRELVCDAKRNSRDFNVFEEFDFQFLSAIINLLE